MHIQTIKTNTTLKTIATAFVWALFFVQTASFALIGSKDTTPSFVEYNNVYARNMPVYALKYTTIYA